MAQQPLGRETLTELQDELRAAPWPRAPMPTVGYHEVPLDGGGARVGPLPPVPRLGPPRPRRPRETSAPEIEVSLTEVSLLALTVLDGGARGGPDAERGDESAEGESDDEPSADEGDRGPQSEAPPSAGERGPGPFAIHDDVTTDLRAADAAGRPTTPAARAPRPAEPNAHARATPPSFDALELRTFVVPTSALSPRATARERLEFVRARFGARLPCPPGRVHRVDVRAFEPGAVMLLVWCPVDP